MNFRRIPWVAGLLVWGSLPAQALQMNVLIEGWYTQMLDTNLRRNGAAKPAGSGTYYDGLSAGRFTENAFTVKRTEIYFRGTLSDTLSWSAMFDPNGATTPLSNILLADAVLTWTPVRHLTVKVGQTKMPAAYEGSTVASKDLIFFDRNQLNRLLGEVRDRCVWLAYSRGEAGSFLGRVNVAASNGTSDDGSKGKNNDLNAQKDWTFRFDGEFLNRHKFGLYYREGVTHLKDSTLAVTVPTTWTVGAPTPAQIMANKDRTTLAGAFYLFDAPTWHVDVEGATGLLGRRFPTLFLAGSPSMVPLREHLQQKFQAFALAGVYKRGAHWLTARYDLMNYNQGHAWYTATDPYQTAPATGLPTGGDYSPRYTETTLGYTYHFVPSQTSLGKLKLNHIWRSRNFLTPRAGQVGEQGGNSLVASCMVAF